MITTLPARREAVAQALAVLRLCDGVQLRPRAGGCELMVMCECSASGRRALEQRLSERGVGAAIGWAEFPSDGVTLETLMAKAREGSRRPRLVRPR